MEEDELFGYHVQWLQDAMRFAENFLGTPEEVRRERAVLRRMMQRSFLNDTLQNIGGDAARRTELEAFYRNGFAPNPTVKDRDYLNDILSP